MKNKEETGLKYTDGTPIRDGDTVIFWHEQESSPKLIPFERLVEWDDGSAAYVAAIKLPNYDAANYLGNEVSDINCKKITKKV